MRRDRWCFARGKCLYLLVGMTAILSWTPQATADLSNHDIGAGSTTGGVWIDAGGSPFTIALAVEVAQTETPTDTPTFTPPAPPATNTPTNTATRTRTFTPTLTFTPGATETGFPTTSPTTPFTLTPTFTPTATETGFPSPTPSGEQKVLFIAVSDRQYDPVADNVFDTLLLANANATYLYLWRNGDAAALIAANNFDQIWVFDLSDRTDGYTTDWQAIADWFNAREGGEIICDARMIASYWEEPFKPDEAQRYMDEGRRLTQNYYENLKQRGGGLLLATDDDSYQNGINSINALIGIEAFSGLFTQDTVPVDTGSPLMTTPNDMGAQLFSDSTPGQAPGGLQPNGQVFYPVAWLSGDIDFPAISCTIEGLAGFHVHITSPADGSLIGVGDTVTFLATPQGGGAPYSYTWISNLDGVLGTGQMLPVSTLSLGQHIITVEAFDGGDWFDTDSISIRVVEAVPSPTATPTVTPTMTPADTATVTPTGTVTLTPTQTIGGLVVFSGEIILDRDLYVPPAQNLAFADGSQVAFLIPQATDEFYYMAIPDGSGNVAAFMPVLGWPPGEEGQDAARAQIIVDGGLRAQGRTSLVSLFPVTPTAVPTSTPTATPTCRLPDAAIVGDATVIVDLGIDPDFNLVLRGVDLDLDHDIDLVMGGESGNLYQALSTNGQIDLGGFSELTWGASRSFSEVLAGDAAPTFADPDGDGDQDLFLADGTGGIFYSRNDGGVGGAVFAFPETVFSASAEAIVLDPPRVIPEVVDLNEDGVLDLVASTGEQKVLFLPGSLSSIPSPVQVNDASFLVFGEPTVWLDYSLAFPSPGSPVLYSLDRNGPPAMVGPGILVGFTDGRMVLLEYLSGPEEGQNFPTFYTWILKALIGDCRVTNAIGGDDASPVFVDYDGDGEGELIVANSMGTFIVYENINIQLLMGYRSPAKALLAAESSSLDLPVPFPPNPSESWGGIVFRARSDDRDSFIEKAHIEKANVGITMLNASPPIFQTEFLGCGEAAIRVLDRAFPLIEDCLISRTHVNGIECLDFSSATIRGTEIRETGQAAIRVADYAVPLITDWNMIVNNWEGILIENLAGPRLGDVPDLELIEGEEILANLRADDDGRNIFQNNRTYDIRNTTRGKIHAENNFWGTADGAEIDARIYDDDENSMMGVVDFLPLGVMTPAYPTVLPTPTPAPPGSGITMTPTPTLAPEQDIGDVVISATGVVWSGIIRITGDVTVTNGVVLNIEPGTIIQAAGSLTDPPVIQILSSTLRAQGTEDEPIIFTSDLDKGWGGLILDGRPPIESTVQHCEILRSTRGLFVKNCSPRFTKVLISGSDTGCVVEQDARDTRPTFRSCTFWRCGTSVRIRGAAHPDLGSVSPPQGTFEPGTNVFFATTLQDINVEQPSLFAPGSIPAQGNYYVQIRDVTSEEGPIRRSERIVFPRVVTNLDDLLPFLSRVSQVYVPEILGYNTRPVNVRPFGQVSGEGTMEDEQIWVGRVEINGDLNVLGKLTLLPGTEVVVRSDPFDPIMINVFAATLYRSDGTVDEALGHIRSLGTPALPVRIHASVLGPRQWEGIRFVGESAAVTSHLMHTSITDTWLGVDCVVASPVLSNCTVARFNDVGVNVTNIISSLDQSLLELAVSQTRHADEIAASEVSNPFGVARPLIAGCSILGDPRGLTAEFGVFSQTSQARIEGTAIHLTRFAGIMARGTHVPDLEWGLNDFSQNFRTNLQNNTMLQIPAAGNFWGVPGSYNPLEGGTANPVDDTIIDDDENGNVGRVIFKPALDAPPARTLAFGDLNGDGAIDGSDLTALLSTWGSIIGQAGYRARADFDRNRAVEREDIIFFSSQWRAAGE
jgi:hypothetical protein